MAIRTEKTMVALIEDTSTPNNNIWVATHGSDTYGGGSFDKPYATVAKAFSVVTTSRKSVILLPGIYTSAASIAWPTGVTKVLLTGISAEHDQTEIRCTAGTEAIDIDPSATIGTENFEANLANLMVNSAGGVRGVTLDNGNMTASKKLIITFRDVGFGADTGTDRSISWEHGDQTGAPIKMYMHGRGFGGNNIEGLVYIDPRDAADRCKCNGMNFEGGIQFGTVAVASEHEFFACIMKLSGGSGGENTQILRANGCVSKTGATYAAAVEGDFATNADDSFLNLAA